MKYFIGLFATVLLMLGLAGGVALGQQRMIADIPFDFIVGDTELPAGEYYLIVHRNVSAIQVLGEKNGVYRLVMPGKLAKDGESEVVFHRYPDGSHFLAQVRIPGTPCNEVLKSKLEAEVTTDWTFKKIAIQLRPSAGSPLRTARSGR